MSNGQLSLTGGRREYGAMDANGGITRATAGHPDPRGQMENYVRERKILGHQATLVERTVSDWSPA